MKDKDGDQDTIIEDLKSRQEQSKQDMLAMQTTMNTETMPAAQGMKKKLTGKLQPAVKKSRCMKSDAMYRSQRRILLGL